jgi:hypothetical protein
MSTIYTNIKNKKLTVETSNNMSPYGTDNKKNGGRWWKSLNQQNYYKSAAYATWYLSNIHY